MEKIVGNLRDHPEGNLVMELFMEYEEGQSAESRHVHELDKLEMALQALEYERKHQVNLQPFWNSAQAYIRSPILCRLLEAMLAQRPFNYL